MCIRDRDWTKYGTVGPRPSESFRAPNQGKYSYLFPEYEVTISRINKRILSIAAERTMESHSACNEAADKFRNQLHTEYPELEFDHEQNTFESQNGNEIYFVTCTRAGVSPFWLLQYIAFGKQQNEESREAWAEFIESSR